MGANILSAATATGVGPWVRSGAGHHAIVITFTGALVAITVTLEGRIAAGPAVILGTKAFSAGEISAKAAYLFVPNTPVDDVRANVTVLTKNGGSPIIRVDYKSNIN